MNGELENYIETLNGEFAPMVDGNYYHLVSQSTFTKAEVSKYIQIKLEEYNIKLHSQVNQVALSYGIEIDQRIINTRSKTKKSKKIKERYDGGDFNMTYRKEVDNFMSLKLTLIEEGVYSRLCKFIHYPTNCIMINGEVPTIETLMTIMDLKERTLRGHLKTLEVKGVIKLVQYGHRKAIYVNPIYTSSGKDLDIETLRMFGLLECDDEKINKCL